MNMVFFHSYVSLPEGKPLGCLIVGYRGSVSDEMTIGEVPPDFFLLWFIHSIVLTVYVNCQDSLQWWWDDHGTWVILRIEVGVWKMMTWQYVIPPPNNKCLSRPLGLVLEYWIYLFWVPMWEVFLFHILLV